MTVLFLIRPVFVLAEEDEYTVYDHQSGFQESFADYEDAYDFFTENLDEYDNLVLKEKERIIEMEYGIVEFAKQDLLAYQSVITDEEKEIDPRYAADVFYLGSEKDGDEIIFALAGDQGRISSQDVILHPLDELSVMPTRYLIKDGGLYHLIKTQLSFEFVTYALLLDEAPAFLKEGESYYSADGHYFYAGCRDLIDDLRSSSKEKAINEDPYYNYFQYLPYRSLSNYSAADLDHYFSETLGFDGRLRNYHDRNLDGANDIVNRSQLYGLSNEFLSVQDLYGVNALLLLAQAIEESEYGKSLASYRDNDLFAVAAYEDKIGQDHYEKVADSIYAYGKYVVSSRFGDHRHEAYNGTFFGDLLSGISASYASDPYFGEKCAAHAYQIDAALSGKDRNDSCILITKEASRINFYSDEELKKIAFLLRNIEPLAFTVLEETENAYKLQIDQTYDDELFYDFSLNQAYIDKEDVLFIFNEEKIGKKELKERTFDFGDGNYHGYQELTINSLNNDLIIPEKEGAEFRAYDDDQAEYLGIRTTELIGGLKSVPETEVLDLGSSYLKITYEDGSVEEKELNSDHLSVREKEAGTQDVTISYQGLTLETKVNIHKADDEDKLAEAVRNDDPQRVRELWRYTDQPLSFAKIRHFDSLLKEKDQRNYVIKNDAEDLDIGFSGLDLSLANRLSFIYTNDTYYVLIEKIDGKDQQKIYEVADGYGFDLGPGIDLSFRFNYQEIGNETPFIVNIAMPDRQPDEICSVYHLDKNGDIVKCRSEFSDQQVSFRASEPGAYQVLIRKGFNEYDVADISENLTVNNMGYDNHRINIELLLAVFLSLFGIAGITMYYVIEEKKDRLWRDFRKSLR